MATLAIKGCEYSDKVIEIFEMLGGRNTNGYNGHSELVYYYIDENGSIECDEDKEIPFPCIYFTLEDFLKEYPYKVGDKVKCWINGYCSINNIKDIQWDSIVN